MEFQLLNRNCESHRIKGMSEEKELGIATFTAGVKWWFARGFRSQKAWKPGDPLNY